MICQKYVTYLCRNTTTSTSMFSLNLYWTLMQNGALYTVYICLISHFCSCWIFFKDLPTPRVQQYNTSPAENLIGMLMAWVPSVCGTLLSHTNIVCCEFLLKKRNLCIFSGLLGTRTVWRMVLYPLMRSVPPTEQATSIFCQLCRHWHVLMSHVWMVACVILCPCQVVLQRSSVTALSTTPAVCVRKVPYP